MWPGFDSPIWCLIWAEFVGSLPCSERFFSGYPSFPPLPKNQHFSHTAPQAYSFKIVTVYKLSFFTFFTFCQRIACMQEDKVKNGSKNGSASRLLTCQSDTFLPVPCIPRLQLTRLATIKHFFTSCASRQTDCNRAAALITVPEAVFHHLLPLLQSLSRQCRDAHCGQRLWLPQCANHSFHLDLEMRWTAVHEHWTQANMECFPC